MSDSERTRRIRLCLDHLAVFLVQTGASQVELWVEIDGKEAKISYGGGMIMVQDTPKDDPEEGWEAEWSLPLELLRQSAPQVDASPLGTPDDEPPRRPAPQDGIFAVANGAGQVGEGRWRSLDLLVRELHPLREDLQILAVDEDGPRALTAAESIQLGFAVTSAQQAHAG